MNRRLLLVLALAGCHPAAPLAPQALTTVTTLDTRRVVGVVELDGNTYIFDDGGVSVLRAGAVVARDDFGPAAPPSTIAAPTGDGRWVMSALRRVTTEGDSALVEPERFGLAPDATWSGVYGAGETTVATSAHALAVATDGHHVALYPHVTATEVAVARGRVALAGVDHVDVWDLAAGTSRAYPTGPAHVAFVDADSAHPRLAVWTPTRLVLEGADGALHPVAVPGPIASAVTSGARLWVLAAGHVAYLDRDAHALRQTAVDAARAERLFGSPVGDVWVASGGHLARYALGVPGGPDPTWVAQIAPVFARVCAKCHLPDGSAGVDLSTAAAWRTERLAIDQRVLLDRSMPPAGTDLSDGDRAAIAAWVGRK